MPPRNKSRKTKSRTFNGHWVFPAWLRSPTAAIFAAGLILPNLLSIVTLGSYIDLSLPPRTAAIMAYATLAICARRIPYALTIILFLAILAADIVWTIAVSFALAPNELVGALAHTQHINFLRSPLYAALIGVLVTTSAATLWLLYRRETLLRANVVALFAAALIFAGVEFATNISPHYQFGALLGRNVPIESAAAKSGFNAVAGTNGRNVVLVLVESLGYLTDPIARRQVDSPLFDARITDKYQITTGNVVYYGSTTSGEMRELCSTRESYEDFTKTNGSSCLPARLRQRGYATMAVHAFSYTMFDRGEWYPVIGFEKGVFGEELVKVTHRLCGGPFRGVCDSDLPPIIAQESAFSKKPKFIYWLTLNTHVPVVGDDAKADFGCEKDAGLFRHVRVCEMAELWRDVFEGVSKLALDPSIGPAEILVVGDHGPPLWSRRARAQFEPGLVPWYRLTPRDNVFAAGKQQKESATR
ncbi:MAG TPA: sulfatase-like hydrolase/transferase [Pseudolabrys sp.]|nr:sulfatase-like hydrolase/transferase [Pseudolabrys sp.]